MLNPARRGRGSEGAALEQSQPLDYTWPRQTAAASEAPPAAAASEAPPA